MDRYTANGFAKSKSPENSESQNACMALWQCRKQLNALFREELERRKKAAAGGGKQGEANDDLMSGLMQMEDEQGKKLCDDEVVDNIVSLVVAGYESTSNFQRCHVGCLPPGQIAPCPCQAASN